MPSRRASTLISLRSLENGVSASTSAVSRGAAQPFIASTTSAPSVGDPLSSHWSPSRARLALLHSCAVSRIRARSARSSARTLPSGPRMWPVGSSPVPVTSKAPSGVQIRCATMRFSVMVPVLSEQITVAAPRVSTACSRRTSARRRTIARAPSASVTVTTAGSPSGTMATASDRPIISISTGSRPDHSPIAATAAPSRTAATPTCRPSWVR